GGGLRSRRRRRARRHRRRLPAVGGVARRRVRHPPRRDPRPGACLTDRTVRLADRSAGLTLRPTDRRVPWTGPGVHARRRRFWVARDHRIGGHRSPKRVVVLGGGGQAVTVVRSAPTITSPS